MGAVNVLVAAVNGNFTFLGQRQNKSQSEQFDIFLEPRFGRNFATEIGLEIPSVLKFIGFIPDDVPLDVDFRNSRVIDSVTIGIDIFNDRL